ncbi:MAG: hypothetical protein ACFFEN_02750 [Candidatus Thorarchaeota archaeon]
MKLYLKRGHFQDKKPCCANLLYEHGKHLEGTARDDLACDDWAYLDFPIKWVYVNGFEAPMGQFNYQELHLKHSNDTQWTIIDSQGEYEYFMDNPIHYPTSPSGEFFAAHSNIRNLKDENKDYDFFLWIFIHEKNQWKLQKKIEIEDWFRIMDFSSDNNTLFLYGYHKIIAISILDYSKKNVLEVKYGKAYFTNAHLSVDRNFLLAVFLTEKKKLRYHVIKLSNYNQIILSRGMNTIKDNIFDIPDEVKIPLAVENGSVLLTISKKH